MDDIDDPVPHDGEALLRVEACGVCPSDIRSYYGTGGRAPWTPGHEVAGVLSGIEGDHVMGLAIGDRVVADWRSVCGQCFYCLAGNPNFCEQRDNFAMAGFAEYTVVPQSVLHRLPASVSFEEASFTEPLACVLNATRAIPIQPGEDVVILGAGPVGLMHVQLAVHRCARVVVVDLLKQRLSVALQLGAHEVVDASKGDSVTAVHDLTGGHGASAVIIAVGSARAVEEGIAMTRKGGVVNLFAGIYPQAELRLDPNLIHYGEVTLTGSHDYGPAEFTAALRLIEHRIVSVAPLVTHRYPLDDIAAAFENTHDQRGLKSIVHPDEKGEV